MSELLESSIYRGWLVREPLILAGSTPHPPWRLFVQKEEDGRWATKDYDEYSEGINVLLNRADRYYDLALVSRRQQFSPPTVKKGDKRYYWKIPADHLWCGYCRRPTEFRPFARHHAFPPEYKDLINKEENRCTICGIRAISLAKRKPL